MRGRGLAAMAAVGLAMLTGGASALQAGGPRAATFDQMSATGAPAIRGFVVSLRGQCGGASPRAERDAIQAADVNGDNQIDFLVSMRGVSCSGRPMPAPPCGPQGCGYVLLASGGGDYQRADFTAHSAGFVPSGRGWAVMADGQTFGGDGMASTAPVGPVTGGPLQTLPPGEAPLPGTTGGPQMSTPPATAPVPSTMGMDGHAYGYATLADLRGVRSAELQQALGYAQEDCGRSALGFGDDAIQTADVNGDGRPDYLIAMSAMTCGGQSQASTWCGTAGCSYDLYASRGADYVHESYSADNVEFVRYGGGMALSMLGRDGETFWVWNGSGMELSNGAAPASQGGGGGGGGGGAGDDQTSVRAVVGSIYDAYAAGFDSGVRIPQDVETPGLQMAMQALENPDMGAMEYDPYCACQDYDNVRYSIGSVTVDGARATATVNFSNFGGAPQRIDLVLTKEYGVWRVDDIIDSHGSLRRAAGR